MKSNFSKTASIVLFTALLALSAVAQPSNGGGPPGQPPSVDQLFEHMDRNKDNRLSQDEIQGPLKNDFSKVDTNKDGYLTKAELEKAPKPQGRGQR